MFIMQTERSFDSTNLVLISPVCSPLNEKTHFSGSGYPRSVIYPDSFLTDSSRLSLAATEGTATINLVSLRARFISKIIRSMTKKRPSPSGISMVKQRSSCAERPEFMGMIPFSF